MWTLGTTNSVITDTTDRYGPIITVGGVGGDFSHTARRLTDTDVEMAASEMSARCLPLNSIL